MEIFQFMAIQKEKLFNRLLKKALSHESIIVLDLEDTLSDFDVERSKHLKKWGRIELKKIFQNNQFFFKNKKIGIRVNNHKSDEYENDLEVISEILKICDLFCIVAPKIESQIDIDENLNFLKKYQINFKSFIPIVETIKGFNNLDNISKHKCISYIIYGHNDYSLETQSWPFLEHDEIEFWKIVTPFIKIIESNKIKYIHPPIPYFSDLNLAFFVIDYLKTICSLPFGIMTINTVQTRLFNTIKNCPRKFNEFKFKEFSFSLEEKIEKAFYLKEFFSKKSRNFGLDIKKRKFISPHEYLSAKIFLDKNNEKF